MDKKRMKARFLKGIDRRLAYYRGTEFEHLFQDKNGKRFDFNTKRVVDPAVKGDLALAYEFVK
jgi:hypothetical protein